MIITQGNIEKIVLTVLAVSNVFLFAEYEYAVQIWLSYHNFDKKGIKKKKKRQYIFEIIIVFLLYFTLSILYYFLI